jgi:hypothetical protein
MPFGQREASDGRMAMIDFLVNNRELVAAIASVIVAALGVVTALLKRNTSHTIRHETVVDTPSSRVGGRGLRPGSASSVDLVPHVSVVGDYLCVQNDSIHRSQVTNVSIRRSVNGIVALLAAPLLGFLALGAWTNGERGGASLLGVFALVGAFVASMKCVYVTTPQGSRLIAKSLFPGGANKLRNEILSWRSG